MITPVFYGHIEKGKLSLDRPDKYLIQIANLEGKKVELVLRKKRVQRSDSQNRWYWGVCVALIANHCGYDPEELHEALKYRFLSNHETDRNGLVRIRSTTSLTTDEFIAFTNRVVRWAAEHLGVFIPSPGQVDYRR